MTEADCREIVETCKKHGVMLAVCHVLRYTLQAQKIKQLIESGTIGDVVNIQLLEPVSIEHCTNSIIIEKRSQKCKVTVADTLP